MPNYQLNVAMGTHKGIIREHNEDAVGYHYPTNFHTLTQKGVLFVIADGVGGLTNGEQASQYAVNRIIELYYLASSKLDPHNALKSCIEQVNSEVFSKFRGQSATTIVAVVICQNAMITAYVGDSRAYIFDGQVIKQHTIDHVNSVYDGNKRKNKLTRAIGHRNTIDIEILETTLELGESVLLLTDGAIPYFSEDDLCSLLISKAPVDIVTNIIQSSNQAGGRDNISVIMVAIEDILDDGKGLQDHIDQLPEQIELDYPTANKNTFRTSRWLLVPILTLILLVVAGLVYSQTIRQDDEVSTQTPVSTTLEPTGTIMTDDANNQTINVTMTNEPDNLSSIVGQTIVFEDVAITYTQLDGDISAFLIVPDKAYRVFVVFTDDNNRVWYQIHDEETDLKGWIDEADLPSHALSN